MTWLGPVSPGTCESPGFFFVVELGNCPQGGHIEVSRLLNNSQVSQQSAVWTWGGCLGKSGSPSSWLA